MYWGTNYELTETELMYRCGPFIGKIKFERITEIVKAKTPWIAIKYVTARKGLKVKFEKYDGIYSSPNTNSIFLEKYANQIVLKIAQDKSSTG